MVKSTVEISQNFVAFSEYMNYNPQVTALVIYTAKLNGMSDMINGL